MSQTTKKQFHYAQVQHPMWLIIAEDTVCAERTPPWGSPTLEDYAQRLVAGLDTLNEYLELHLNFDFSGVELEDLAKLYPELAARMREFVKKGRISFVNGTYSQPHLQILSVESAIRQYQYGMRVIEDLVGYKVTCYAAQEPGFSPQLPQILRAFCFKSSTTSDFPYGVKLERGQIQHWDRRWEWLEGDDIINWKGLDGTMIPIWLKARGYLTDRLYANEVQHGEIKCTKLRVDMPDMKAVSAQWIADIERYCDFAQLDLALEQMIKENPPYSIGEIDSNYAYSEGIDAEELSRANVRAESAILSLEALESFIPAGKQFDYDSGWKTILKSQHHDAYWVGAPELRAKSISWLNDVTAAASDKIAALADTLGKRLPSASKGSQAVLVLHPYARKHSSPVEVKVSDNKIALTNEKGRKTPVQMRSNSDGSTSAVFVASAKGLGYQTLFLNSQSKEMQVQQKSLSKSHKFSNDFYSVNVERNGTVASLTPKGGANLIKKNEGLGGNVWLYQDDNKDILPEAIGNAKITQGPVFDLVETPTQVGKVKVTNRLCLYHALPWFTVETELDFAEPTDIGDYFDDRTKLQYAWSIGSNMSIRNAIGGAYAEARPKRGFLVSPWLDVSNTKGGMAVTMFNAAECWLDEEGWLRCQVAWGHKGDHFHNRMGPMLRTEDPLGWFKVMDIRLKGKYTVKYAVLPHSGILDKSEIVDWSASLLLPPTAHLVKPGNGEAPLSETFVSIKTNGIIPLSVRPDKKGSVLRMMEVSGKQQPFKLDLGDGLKATNLRNLDSTKTSKVNPHKIVEAHIER